MTSSRDLTVALQLHSVREAMRYDPFGTLEKVAAAGYRNIELSTHDALTPSLCYGTELLEIGRRCAELGLHIIGGQVRNLALDNIAPVLEIYRGFGSAHLTLSIDYFPTPSAVEDKARLYSELGVAAARAGVSFYYAHHYHEFQIADGETVLDGLLRRTDPQLVRLAFNPYWLMRGLIDPVATYRRYADRIGIVEQSDFPIGEVRKLDMWSFGDHHPIARGIRFDTLLRGGEIENIHPVQCNLFTELGEGIVKQQEIIDLASASGRVRYLTLRQDFTRMPTEFESISRSAENYRRLRGLSWN